MSDKERAGDNDASSAKEPLRVEVDSMILKVEGDSLDLPLGPEKLATALDVGRSAIIGAINTAFAETKRRNPDATVFPPPLFVVRFKPSIDKKQRVLTPLGMDNYTSIHREIDEISWPYRPYWRVVEDSGFQPEVHSHYKGYGPKDGIWLMLHALESDIV